MVIMPGDSVDFAADGTDPNGLPLIFVWDFGRLGGSTSQNPGTVTFDRPGNYEIEMTVINAAGIPDPRPASVTITVGTPPPN
jgi:PKD repeat protein